MIFLKKKKEKELKGHIFSRPRNKFPQNSTKANGKITYQIQPYRKYLAYGIHSSTLSPGRGVLHYICIWH